MSGKKTTAVAVGIRRRRKAGGKPFTGKDDPRNGPGFQPGISGNPSGRPKGRVESQRFIEDRIQERIADLVDTALLQAIGYRTDATEAEKEVTRSALAAGLRKGSPTILTELIERVAGKMTDRVEIDVAGEARRIVQAALKIPGAAEVILKDLDQDGDE